MSDYADAIAQRMIERYPGHVDWRVFEEVRQIAAEAAREGYSLGYGLAQDAYREPFDDWGL